MPRRRALVDDIGDMLRGEDPKARRLAAKDKQEAKAPELVALLSAVNGLDAEDLDALEDAIYDRRRALEDEGEEEES